MGDVEIEGRVIGIAADTYVIDIGVALGSTEGSYYLVYSEGGDVYDDNGAHIGVYKIPKAVIRAEGVSMSESICKIVLPSKEWVIQRGDGVIPITEGSAHGMKFATFRTTPDSPRMPGYNGRWVRVSPISDSVSVIVKYFVPWINPGLSRGYPYAAPGYYYLEFPMTVPVGASGAEIPYAPPPRAAVAPPLPAPTQPMYRLDRPDYVLLPDFDVNQITDARLIKTFPLTEVEMYALEIQHRGAYALYSQKRYHEALDSFSVQSLEYFGNYLSPYWAGRCAQKIKEGGEAVEWFKRALAINPDYQPAKNALTELERTAR
ncbi:MAG: hypothetical protein LBS45_01665 [Synergistaceae bacterium]|jgi:hypothetical protein|nr:hypothetical protein [Synergistaceae bacterium]